ncbi:MAG: thioredoxin domain-containing protein, partial [Gemmatimonadaceae bacterium]
RLGAHLWQATKNDEVRRVTEETIDWAVRELRSPEGGFYSSFDADSEGHEGKFYVWTAEEINAVLGGDAAVMREYWGVTERGNFEDRNILSVVGDARTLAARHHLSAQAFAEIVARSKAALYAVRKVRVWPGLDDKILASWNGLMVRGIAEAARAFDNDAYRKVAVESAEFLFTKLQRDGRVLRSYKNGTARIAGYLEDHASLGLASIAVYELTFDATWLARAREIGDAMVKWFWSDEAGAFYDTASDHEQLITRPREISDNAMPSGTSLAVELLLRLAELFDDAPARQRATYVAETLAPSMARFPTAFGHLLGSADMIVNGAVEVAIAGDPASADFVALERAAGEQYVPSLVLAGGEAPSGIALLAGREMRSGRAAAYVCRNYACNEPAASAEMLAAQLAALGAQR